jgi:hypothetical protein
MVLPGLILILSLAGAGCSTAAARPDAVAPAAGRTIRVSAAQFGTSIMVRVGDVLKIARPASHETWTLDFSRDVLRSLNTEEGRRTPPADGWTFAVVGTGTTDLAATAHSPRGGTGNVPRFVLSITAE